MSLIPKEVFDRLDHASRAMDDMNAKLDRVIELLEAVIDVLEGDVQQ